MDHASPEFRRFEALYRAHYAAIVRFIRRRVDPSMVDELVADVFAVAWRRLDAVPGEPLPWLYRVARNVISERRRAAGRDARRLADLAAMGLSSSRDPADLLAERDRVLRAFATLSESDREALRLVAWDGLDHRAAAEVVGTTAVAFRMRISRARRRLAAALAEADELTLNPAITETRT